MTCYFRHIRDVFRDAGIEITQENKRDVDRAIHRIAGVEYKDCPATWKALKADFLGDEAKRADLVKRLIEALG